jgi:hypothetical protein
MLVLRKLLFLLILFNVAAFAQHKSDSVSNYELFSKSLSQAVEKDFTIETILIVVAVVALLVVAVVFYEVHRTSKLRKELMTFAWVKFDKHARRLNLSPREVAMLKEIIQASDLQGPDSALESPRIFEISLEKYYESKGLDSIPKERLAEIRNLRQNLHFLPLSREVAFTSTRQFDGGEKCLVQIPADKPTHKGMCVVVGVEERQWVITRPEGLPIPVGTLAYLNLTRPGDAEYMFKTQILKDSETELVLSHAIKLNRTQQRNWVRVDVSLPVEVTQVEKGRIGDIFSGKIIDMSGGGFGLALPVKLLNGSSLLLEFELPGRAPIIGLPVKVVRVAGQYSNDSTKIVYSVAFDGDVHLVQEQIVQYVFEKQRRDAMAKNA